MATVSRGIPLKPEQFVAQWQPLPHKFDLNVWDFQVSVGKAAVDIFQKSFDYKRFNSKGSFSWKTSPKKNRGGFRM